MERREETRRGLGVVARISAGGFRGLGARATRGCYFRGLELVKREVNCFNYFGRLFFFHCNIWVDLMVLQFQMGSWI